MLKYLIIQLDESSVSFCHYPYNRNRRKLIDIDQLRKAIVWSMKENLTLQILYPDYGIPEDYKKVISQTYHADIVPAASADKALTAIADVVVFDTLASVKAFQFKPGQVYVFRLKFSEAFENLSLIFTILHKADRINIVFTDIPAFKDSDKEHYEVFLSGLAKNVVDEYENKHPVQLNLLTDRIILDSMNNCNAGYESITLCADGKFYICPAFYSDSNQGYSVGDLDNGLEIKNPQLYRLDHAPICRNCDAWQCRRCVWLNRKLTLEINTPGHQQCLMAHIERNASRKLLEDIRKLGVFYPEKEIPQIDYFDPFDKIIEK